MEICKRVNSGNRGLAVYGNIWVWVIYGVYGYMGYMGYMGIWQTCQHFRFGRESPDLKANSDLPSAFCFISQSPAFHKKTKKFFEKVVFHLYTMKLSDLLGHKNRLHIINCALVTRRDCLI